MENTPEPLYTFPMPILLKVLGADQDEFAALVLAIVRQHAPEIDASALSQRQSSAGKYVSVTVSFTAHSCPQLNAIYQALGAHPRILMVL